MKRLGILFVISMICTGCGLDLRMQLRKTNVLAKQARDNGAYRCAPVDLAMAESHADFTAMDLDQGDYFRAREELDIAQKNAKLAYEHSPREKCVPKVVVPIIDTDKDGLPDNIDKCPLDPEDKDNFQDEDGCPDLDNDQDGIADTIDKCPLQPEDKDGFQDEDGCPDFDNDNDGLLDKDDKCPNEPGPAENQGCPDKDRDGDGVVDRLDRCPDVPGPAENQGCPLVTYKKIELTKDKIELREKIHFATNKYKIMPDSFAMLNEIADLMSKNPAIEVRIEGHTDARAKRKFNMVLSQNRANSVEKYLEKRGIAVTRMSTIGYGPDRPIDDNRTAIGREKNRRVEFFIVKQ